MEKQHDIRVSGKTNDAQDTVKRPKELEPDIMLMDVSLPGRGIGDKAHKIGNYLPGTRAIGLTTVTDEQYSITITRMGASQLYCLGRPQ